MAIAISSYYTKQVLSVRLPKECIRTNQVKRVYNSKMRCVILYMYRYIHVYINK